MLRDFEKKLEEQDKTFKKLFENKAEKFFVTEKINDVKQIIKENQNELWEYKAMLNNKFETISKTITKLENSIGNKAEKEHIWEVREQILNLVTKQ